jgi:hypothetical protein
MPHLARHSFVGGLLLLLGVFASPHALAKASAAAAARQTPPPAVKRPLRMLALGDSVMWGQGLLEQNKFSFKLRDWLCAQRGDEYCQGGQGVHLHAEAHSGAIISKPDNKRREAEERFTRDTAPIRYAGEVNNAYPTLWGQLELARRYYRSNSIPAGEVDLVLVNGCINDISASRLLVHRLVGGNVKKLAEKYCRDEMKRFLPEVADAFPNARIVVPGYFPLVSECTPPYILFETLREWLFGGNEAKAEEFEAFQDDWAGQEPWAALPCPPTPDTAKTTRTMKRLAERSREFVEKSNEALKAAVKHLNEKRPPLAISNADSAVAPPDASARALFVAVPFGHNNAYAAPNSFLWRLGRKDPALVLKCADDNFITRFVVNDEMQKDRPCMCDQAERKNDQVCFRAGAFHPNREGANAYFESISRRLEPILRFTGWAAKN